MKTPEEIKEGLECMGNAKEAQRQKRAKTKNPKQEYLSQAFDLDKLINSHIAERENLKRMALSLGGTSFEKERVQGGNLPGSPFENTVAKLVDLEAVINTEIDRLVDLKAEIRHIINSLINRKERLVLRYRYIEFLSWEDIQEKMEYEDVRRVYQIHKDALKKIRIPLQ